MLSRQMLKTFLSGMPGRLGLALLGLLFAISAYVLLTYPLNFGLTRWNNPAVWADNPKATPPVWTNWLGGNHMPHTILATEKPEAVETFGDGETRLYRMSFDYRYDEPPTFLALTIGNERYTAVPPLLTVYLNRPDGTQALLYQHVAPGPRPGEQAPYSRYSDEPLRILLSGDATVRSAVAGFFRDTYDTSLADRDLRDNLSRVLFSLPSSDSAAALEAFPGRYQVLVQVEAANTSDTVELTKIVLGGSVYGVMGTDAIGRDIAQGLLFGFPIALFIGIVASILSTGIGAGLGVLSGYVGGKTDMVIQRICDILANVPVLPLLIFLVFLFGAKLYLTILALVAFSWPGLTILVRSMVLQLRSGQLTESAKSIGASRWRIMGRHVFPHTAPYVLAQLIFFTPGAILAEAGLSFLGLGDPSLPTWGQILEAGFRTGAVYIGYWWWIVPPGMLIVLTAVTFMLLSLAIEPVLNPRLRKI